VNLNMMALLWKIAANPVFCEYVELVGVLFCLCSLCYWPVGSEICKADIWHLTDKSHGLPGFVVEGNFNIVMRQEVKALDIFPPVGHFKVHRYML
jgi:hypothetical protein